jgi:anti-anti-sigma factor
VTEATVETGSEGATAWVRIAGEVDLANSARVEREIMSAIGNEMERAVLHLGDVEYFDSAGIRILSRLAVRLNTVQIALEVVAPEGSRARRVIELSGLGPLVHVRDV